MSHHFRRKMQIKLYIYFCAIFLTSEKGDGFPTHSEPVNSDDLDEVINYMARYTNFVRDSPLPAAVVAGESSGDYEDSAILNSPDSPLLIESLISFQKLAGLPTTGIITEEVINKTRQPRCGVPDPSIDPNAPSDYRVKSIWRSKYNSETGLFYVTYSILSLKTPKSIKMKEFQEGLAMALCSWELVSNVRFTNIGKGKSKADITAQFHTGNHGDGYSFDGPGATLAHAFYPEDGRLHFDGEENWHLTKEKTATFGKKDIYNTALHELGHILGLLHSDNTSAIMSPFYRFYGKFEDFKMPEDDRGGILKMYGSRRNYNPVEEESSACRELNDKYSVEVPIPDDDNVVVSATLSRAAPECEDDFLYLRLCSEWSAKDFCTKDYFAKLMHKKCKKSCGFCPGPIPKSKLVAEEVSSLVTSICHIPNFDTLTTLYDEHDGFSAYVFKDDYYFEDEITLAVTEPSTQNLLNDSKVLHDAIFWHTDPKTIIPGTFKIRSPDFFDKARKMNALLSVGHRFFAFDGDVVHVYSKLTPLLSFKRTVVLSALFPGYPHSTIDAVYAEHDASVDGTIYSLFHGNRLWQYTATTIRNELDGESDLYFHLVMNMSNVDIQEWKGIPACDVDAVFQYRGIPYFLKNNIFWPATDAEPQIPRDITYNFFRCWQEQPRDLSIPSSCRKQTSAQNETPPGNHSSVVTSVSLLMCFRILFLSLSSLVFSRIL